LSQKEGGSSEIGTRRKEQRKVIIEEGNRERDGGETGFTQKCDTFRLESIFSGVGSGRTRRMAAMGVVRGNRLTTQVGGCKFFTTTNPLPFSLKEKPKGREGSGAR